MRFPFFSKSENPDSNDQESASNEIVPINENELSLTFETDSFEIEKYVHESFSSEIPDGVVLADRVVPLAAAAAEAAEQYGHAIVKFPKGAGWKDLIDRKTPGFEGWKQVGILKDGKFQPQAAIKQAKLQPVAVANLALQGAAIAVGQAYMTEINKQLEGIESGIQAIQREMALQRNAQIQADFDMLQEYLTQYSNNLSSPEKMQAILGNIESIKTDTRAAWAFQVKSLQELNDRVLAQRGMKDSEVRAALSEFMQRERESLAAFQLMMAAERVSMQYDGDFSSNRIEQEQQLLSKYLQEFENVRTNTQATLNSRIDALKSDILAIPEAPEDDYQAQNPLFDAVHEARKQVPRVNPVSMRKEAKKQLEEKKKRYLQAVSGENEVSAASSEYSEELKRLNFAYNQADTMAIDENGVHFLKTSESDAESNSPAVEDA